MTKLVTYFVILRNMQKAISIVLVFLILVSFTGITYAKHFCGDTEMVSVITLGEKRLNCAMKIENSTCNNDIQDTHSCCNNKYTNIEIDDSFTETSFNVLLKNPFVASFISVFVLQQIELNPQSLQFYADYYPPPIYKDIPVLYQVFFI